MTHQETWETYTLAWKTNDLEERRTLLKNATQPNARYTDPLVQTEDRQGLMGYMREFNKLFPGTAFVTTYFLDHHDQCIVRWNMVDGDGNILSEGISHGRRYATNGKLTRMTGFFEVPA